MKTFFIKTFGCRVNQVESQAILEQFRRAGYAPASLETASVCVLNTCSVTHQADKDVEKYIRQILRRNPSARLVLTGCYAMVHQTHIRQVFPTAQIVGKHDLGRVLFDTPDICWMVSDHEGHSRAFIKIQDGCDNFCSYCLVPYARPVKTSKPAADVLQEIQQLLAHGFLEIVLTGINIGNYCCPQTGADLAALCHQIAALGGHFRIRFSSIELPTVTDGIITCMQQFPNRFCNYLHLPLQAGCDSVLKHMNRHYTTQDYADKVALLRKHVPQIGIFADVIAGFPTETQADFEATYQFIQAQQLAGLHVFSYSPRPHTAAAQLPQLPPQEIKYRADKLRQLDHQLRCNFAASLVGTTQSVFIEERQTPQPRGLTSNFQTVLLPASSPVHGLVSARIVRSEETVCIGEVLANGIP